MKILHDSDISTWQGSTIRTIIEVGGTEVEVMCRIHEDGKLALTVTDMLAAEDE